MYAYDSKTRILKVYKLGIQPPKVNIMEDVINSYEKYLAETVHEDIDYVARQIEIQVNERAYASTREVSKKFEIRAKARVGDKVSTVFPTEVKTRGNEFYPVYATFFINGEPGEEVEVFRIPYLDRQMGVLNVNSKQRVMTSALRSADDLSFSVNKNELTLTIKSRHMILKLDKETICFESPYNSKQKVNLELALNSFVIGDGKDIDIRTLFTNPLIRNSISDREFQQNWYIKDEASKTSFYNVYSHSDLIIMDYLRETLNKTLSLDAALGLRLSRHIFLEREGEVISSGTVVDLSVLERLKYNLVNEIYVHKIPEFEKMYTTQNIDITELKRKCRMSKWLKSKFPHLAKYNYVPETQPLPTPWRIPKGTLVTSDVLEFLEMNGFSSLILSPTLDGKDKKEYTFEQEFVGNNFHRIGDFIRPEMIPEDYAADEYLYIDDIDTNSYLPKCNSPGTRFLVWDILALASLAGRCFTMPELREVFDRDVDFLKKIDLIGDSFSLYFRDAARKVIADSRRKLQYQVSSIHSSGITKEIFYSMTDTWHKRLWDSKLMKPCDDTNPISLLTQVRRVTSAVGNSKEFSAEIRNISIGYFGKLCPYETPEGANIGLVNTLAHGCKIVNGIPKTPYFAVRSSNSIKYLSSQVTYLSAKEESLHIIGDIAALDFIPEDEHNFKGVPAGRAFRLHRTVARVPDYTTGNRSKLSNIDSYSLEYVSCYPEQHCSLTTQLIPFAQNNDAVRDSFALSRIRQALNIQEGEPPRVLTSMYYEMFEGNHNFVVRAKKSGFVLGILSEDLYLQYDDGEEECIKVPEIRISDNCVVLLNYRKNENERFEAGDVIVDSSMSRGGIFSPGASLLMADVCYYGYNYEDSCVISESAQRKFVSIANDAVKTPLRLGQQIKRQENSNMYRYVNDGETIVELSLTDDKKGKSFSNKRITADNVSGIVYSIGVEMEDYKSRDVVAKLMSFRKVGQGDKMCGLHANKGVCPRPIPDANMLCLNNGKILEYLPNPAGINSRMNIGQVLEAHLGLVATILDIHIQSNSFNGASFKDIRELLQMTWVLCNESVQSARDKFPHIPSALFDHAETRQEELDNWKGVFYPNGTAPVYNPETKTFLEYPAVIGYTYHLKLIQEVDEKIHSRSSAMEEPYSAMSKQPTKGSAAKGGQKVGEMEASSVDAHGAAEVLREMFNEKSDNVFWREVMLLKALGREDLLDEVLTKISDYGAEPHSLTMLRYYLEGDGIILEGDELADLNGAHSTRWEINFPALIVQSQVEQDTPVEAPVAVSSSQDFLARIRSSTKQGG